MTATPLHTPYQETLMDSEIGLLTSCSITSKEVPHTLPYDDRIKVFQMLSKSPLFTNQDILTHDLHYWFPECAHPNLKKQKVSKTDIEHSLECLLALMMEGEIA